MVVDLVDAVEPQQRFLRHLLLIPARDLSAKRDAALVCFKPQAAASQVRILPERG